MFVNSPVLLPDAPMVVGPVLWFAVLADSPELSLDVTGIDLAPLLAALFSWRRRRATLSRSSSRV